MNRPLCFALAFVLLFWIGIGSYPLAEPDEARNGEIVREEVRLGNWVPPTCLGKVRYQKPPLFYWLAGLIYRNHNSIEFSVRAISALSATLLVFLVYVWGYMLAGAGDAAALLFSSFPLVFFYARVGRMEMLLTLLCTLAIFFTWLGITRDRRMYLVISSLFCALAFITKGPVAFLFFLSALIPWVLAKDRSRIFSVASVVLVSIIISLPVFLLLEMKSPGYCYNFFWKENVLRYTTPIFHRDKPFYYFFAVTVIGLFPWVFYITKALDSLLNLDEDRYLFVGWILLPTVFFSFSKSKLPHYILPVFPAWAIIMGLGMRSIPKKLAVILLATYAVAVLFIMPQYLSARSLRDIGSRIKHFGPIPVYTLDDKIYGASLYTDSIAVRLKKEELPWIDGRAWVVLRKKKLGKLMKHTRCEIEHKLSSGLYLAVMLNCD